MYRLQGRGIKILKIFHLFGASCWLGGAICMILLNRAGAQAEGAGMLYGINFASHAIDMWVVVTFGVYVCLMTGLCYGLFTPWGFFRQRWVAVKWALTVICFSSGWILLGRWEGQMLEISSQTGERALQNADYLRIRASHFWLSLLQITMLMAMFAISVIKPWKKREPGKV